MLNALQIRSINQLPAGFVELVKHSDLEGFNFLTRMQNEWADKTNRFTKPGECLLVAEYEKATIGVCGVNIDPYTSDIRVARLRHLYVRPDCRQNGVGSKLVIECLQRMPNSISTMRLRVPNSTAGRFYEKLGFLPVASEHATHCIEV